MRQKKTMMTLALLTMLQWNKKVQISIWEIDNLDHYPKFFGQTRNPIEATYADVEDYFGEDEQPELYYPEDRDSVKFDRFDKFEQNVEKF